MNERPNSKSTKGTRDANSLRARRLGVDTQYEAVVFMHKDCDVCRSEGFTAHTRVLLCNDDQHVIATLYQTTGNLVAHDEAALSEPFMPRRPANWPMPLIMPRPIATSLWFAPHDRASGVHSSNLQVK